MVVHFHAAALESASLAFHGVTGDLSLNVHTGVPKATLDVKIANLMLGSIPVAHRPGLLDGFLRARIHLKGQGNSLHAMASKANGTVAVVLPHGEVRSSVAELVGLDLRGLGFLATGNTSIAAIRCGEVTRMAARPVRAYR